MTKKTMAEKLAEYSNELNKIKHEIRTTPFDTGRLDEEAIKLVMAQIKEDRERKYLTIRINSWSPVRLDESTSEKKFEEVLKNAFENKNINGLAGELRRLAPDLSENDSKETANAIFNIYVSTVYAKKLSGDDVVQFRAK